MSARGWLAALGAALVAGTAGADITYDGSSASAPEAPPYSELTRTWLIEESAGVQRGSNLFHGFERFDLDSGETAFFHSTGLLAIEHVIARVSGGVPSSIHGTIESDYAADLYLLNPAGVIFGAGARLNLNGSFVASTADVLRLGPEGIEVALGRADPFPLLAVAAPSSFGFLGGGPPAAIQIESAKLTNAGRAHFLALLGDRVDVERSLVSAPTADLYVAAVRSGDVGIRDTLAPRFDFSQVDSWGSILLDQAALSTSGIEPPGTGRWPLGAPVAVSGSGNVWIRGGDLLGIDSDIFANTNGPFDGGSIDIELDGSLAFERRAFQGVGIFAFSQLPRLVIPPSAGSSGDIRIRARELSLRGGAQISTGAFGEGLAGGIDIGVTERVSISGRDLSTAEIDESGLVISTEGGRAGDLVLRARELVMDDFGVIVGETRRDAQGGVINIEVDRLELSGNARIDSSTRGGTGKGGDINVKANESIHISGSESEEEFSGISVLVQPQGSGAPGSITVETPSLLLADGGRIATTALGATTDGGNITIQARDRVELENSEISASVKGGAGGNIDIDPEFVILRNGRIVAQAGSGSGGNIDISAGLFVADEDSLVSASSATGLDGTVLIHSPDADLVGELAALPGNFVDPADLLADHCAAREAHANGSLTVRELDALPDWPGQLRPSRYAIELTPSAEPALQEIWSAARAAEQRGDRDLAFERWEHAAALAETPTLRAAAKLGSAQALEDGGRYERALAKIEEALAALGSGGNGVAAAAHALRARLRASSVDLERALEQAPDSALRARIQSDLANAQLRSGEQEAARGSYGEAERLAAQAGDAELHFIVRANRARLLPADLSRVPDDHDAAFAALHTLMDALDLGAESDTALEPLERIAEAAARRGDTRAQSFARTLRAELYAREGETEDAVAAARKALLLAQRARAPEAELVASRVLGRELGRLGQDAAAVRALESAYTLRAGRFAGIPDAQTASAPHASWFATAPLLDELVDALLRLSATTEDPAERERLLLAARDHLDDRTALALREYFADECVAAQRVVSAATLPGAVVVYPALLPDRVELIVSSGRGTRSVLVGATSEQIVSEARRLTELSQQRTSRRYREPAARLYDWLIRPLEAELGEDGGRTLVVVPRGALLRVPWAALYDAPRRSHLIERYPLAIVPGLSLAESRPVSGEVRALKAGVSEGVQGLPALPAVTRELGEIGSLYGGATLLDEGFSAARLEAALRAEPYSVVHIASHASFGARVEDAYVVTWDGRLGAQHLAELVELTRFRDRPLELLTLSACDTSVGDERAALGLAGLAVRAGARSTLGTLWPVNDEAAAELIGHFYRELSRPGASRAEALQSAQQAALAEPDFEHPAYWSPFVMIGSWQ